MIDKKSILSSIPSVDELMKDKELERLAVLYSRTAVVEGIREYLGEYRKYVMSAKKDEELDAVNGSDIMKGIIEKIHNMMRNNLVNVVNATGVVLHTNLGRSPLSSRLKDTLWNIASRYSNLEMDLEAGERGSRYSHVEELICKLTGAEAAMAVNNNAAAVMLVLSTMAKGREVVVSRGQLVEIGGSFRVPDVMKQSGAALVEVGTTNKTHLEDYESAVNENTAALMKVHTSNYRILGFTSQVESEELVVLGRKLGLPVIEDLGSGLLMELTEYGLPYEPTVQQAVKAGMDVVTFSGDKMLGGPQAGIIVGKREYIDKMKKNPLTRAMRIDKLTLAALEGTLKLYTDKELALAEIPVLRMLTYDGEELGKKARRLGVRLKKSIGDMAAIGIEDEFSEVGGGSMPLHKMPTKVVAIKPKAVSLTGLEEKLRAYKTPVIARIARDRLLLDIRTIMDDEYKVVENAMLWAFTQQSGSKLREGEGQA
ncbi:MAG: L-seryl-tRNA(Sec) selenium transferase [Clostridia bacterium]|jgi:L-seryl-tRNA(Ser) seleniumtransferase|nr:L-seryl-tRNA(Sec) selenium transferase [Clostridia bacterium]